MDQSTRKQYTDSWPVNACAPMWLKPFTLTFFVLTFFVFASSVLAQEVESDAGDAQTDSSLAEQAELPTWVAQGSFVEGDDEYMLVETDPNSQFAKHYLAAMAIDPAIEIAVKEKMDQWFGLGAGQVAAINDPDLLKRLVPDHHRHIEVYHIDFDEEDAARFDTETEEFFRGYAQLRFDKPFRVTAEKIWRRNRTRNRLVYTASIGAAILGVLGIAYGFLHFNHLTRGFYVGRLQMFAVALIVLVIAMSYYAAQALVP